MDSRLRGNDAAYATRFRATERHPRAGGGLEEQQAEYRNIVKITDLLAGHLWASNAGWLYYFIRLPWGIEQRLTKNLRQGRCRATQ